MVTVSVTCIEKLVYSCDILDSSERFLMSISFPMCWVVIVFFIGHCTTKS